MTIETLAFGYCPVTKDGEPVFPVCSTRVGAFTRHAPTPDLEIVRVWRPGGGPGSHWRIHNERYKWRGKDCICPLRIREKSNDTLKREVIEAQCLGSYPLNRQVALS